jgi:Tol biopolymer transport system component
MRRLSAASRPARLVLCASGTALAAAMAAVPAIALAAEPGVPTAVDLAADGGRPNDRAYGGDSVSADGRYVAFTSFASNLVSGDTNGWLDVFVRDTQTGTTQLVSVSSTGVEGNAPSSEPSISADGRYIAFESRASNLVPNDTNEINDVFVRDLQAGTTTRVSVTAQGAQGGWHDRSTAPSISVDGRYVAFESEAALVPADTEHRADVYVYDRVTATPERVSVSSAGQAGNAWTYFSGARISADGRFVTFSSDASNLALGDVNGQRDVFLRDRLLQTTQLVSATPDGTVGNGYSEDPSISADGRYVAFKTLATNLGDGATSDGDKIYVRDTQTGALTREDRNAAGQFVDGRHPQLSADGRYLAMVAFSGLVEGKWAGTGDIYVRDRQSGAVVPASHGVTGQPATRECLDLALSADGRHVAFVSDDGTLVAGDTDRADNVFFTTLPG